MSKPKRYVLLLLIVLGLIAFLLVTVRYARSALLEKDTTPPVIDVWYGTRQVFGQPALMQRWVNILGNVADPESGITRLRYQLNNGPVTDARLGPDQRRLVKPGDFNIEIDPRNLRSGDNRLELVATNGRGLDTSRIVTVIYYPGGATLPLPYQIDWSKVQNAQDVLQIVDGRWRWDASGIRPVEIGYDRLLAVGDPRWTNYQVTLSVVMHAIDTAGFHDKNSGEQASVSVDLRWIGHSDDPVKCPPPHCGWNPIGDFNKFFFRENRADYLSLKINEKETTYPMVPYQFDSGDTYIFKVSVQTTPQGNLYRMKVWEKHKESEPANWMFQRLAPADSANPDHGAFALVAHYTDVTFGNILVQPLP